MVGDHIGYFGEGDLVLMGPELPHVWVNDNSYLEKKRMEAADATVIHFHRILSVRISLISLNSPP